MKLPYVLKSWYRHITGYWEKKLPHLFGANSKQFWNIINGRWTVRLVAQEGPSRP